MIYHQKVIQFKLSKKYIMDQRLYHIESINSAENQQL
jgi:hypothetical protein